MRDSGGDLIIFLVPSVISDNSPPDSIISQDGGRTGQ